MKMTFTEAMKQLQPGQGIRVKADHTGRAQLEVRWDLGAPKPMGGYSNLRAFLEFPVEVVNLPKDKEGGKGQ